MDRPLPIVPMTYAKAVADIPVTADTITDDEIREIRDMAHSHGDGDPDFVVLVCDRALRKRAREVETKGQFERVRQSARARCAEILNARSGK